MTLQPRRLQKSCGVREAVAHQARLVRSLPNATAPPQRWQPEFHAHQLTRELALSTEIAATVA